MTPVVTLLSDFGYQDTYVGVMKGVILQRCPSARLIDLTHAIAPQNLVAARFHLLSAYAYFARGTIHLAVVDPGVGSQRRAVAVQFDQGYLVGPDNGIFSGVLQACSPIAAVELSNPDYWLSPQPSQTFHGRDIFAPAAAHLATGELLSDLGPAIDVQTLAKLPVPNPERSPSLLTGTLQHIDHFGNLITDLPGYWVEGRNWQVAIADKTIPSVSTYSDIDLGQLAACIGSHGWVEIIINGGSAWEHLRLRTGSSVEIRLS
ncbi:hypothetical protein C7271_15125 [filamentous cyanobacterium CCP5]|nr:hypothetical protein C7271_15125 [filamentous cyanobacterium CCP5]